MNRLIHEEFRRPPPRTRRTFVSAAEREEWRRAPHSNFRLTYVVHRLQSCHARQDDDCLPGLDQRLAGPPGPLPASRSAWIDSCTGLHPDLMPLELRGIRAINRLHSSDRVQRTPMIQSSGSACPGRCVDARHGNRSATKSGFPRRLRAIRRRARSGTPRAAAR